MGGFSFALAKKSPIVQELKTRKLSQSLKCPNVWTKQCFAVSALAIDPSTSRKGGQRFHGKMSKRLDKISERN